MLLIPMYYVLVSIT